MINELITCGISPGVLGTDNKHGFGPEVLISLVGAGVICGTAKCSGRLFLLHCSTRFDLNLRSANR